MAAQIIPGQDFCVTLADLTRSCCAHEHYVAWLNAHSTCFDGSRGIANYLISAAEAFEEQAQCIGCVDDSDARDTFADILMASAPLSCDDLRQAATLAIQEARESEAETYPPLRLYSVPSTHPKFERGAAAARLTA